MADKKTYDFPGGVCPACEHTPLNVEISTNDYGGTFVWFVCPSCGNKEMLPSLRTRSLQRAIINYRASGRDVSRNDSGMLVIFAERLRVWTRII